MAKPKEIKIDKKKWKKKIKDFAEHPEKYAKAYKQETPECSHPTLKQFLEKTGWYQCKECKTIFFLTGQEGWEEETFKNLVKELGKRLNKKKGKNERN